MPKSLCPFTGLKITPLICYQLHCAVMSWKYHYWRDCTVFCGRNLENCSFKILSKVLFKREACLCNNSKYNPRNNIFKFKSNNVLPVMSIFMDFDYVWCLMIFCGPLVPIENLKWRRPWNDTVDMYWVAMCSNNPSPLRSTRQTPRGSQWYAHDVLHEVKNPRSLVIVNSIHYHCPFSSSKFFIVISRNFHSSLFIFSSSWVVRDVVKCNFTRFGQIVK